MHPFSINEHKFLLFTFYKFTMTKHLGAKITLCPLLQLFLKNRFLELKFLKPWIS